MKKYDFILIGAILCTALVSYIAIKQMNLTEGSFVSVYVNGKWVEDYSLAEDQTVQIDGYKGGKNIFVIKAGMAFMEEANCPDRLCIYQKEIGQNGETIVCLPNRVVIEVKNKNESELDDYAY